MADEKSKPAAAEASAEQEFREIAEKFVEAFDRAVAAGLDITWPQRREDFAVLAISQTAPVAVKKVK